MCKASTTKGSVNLYLRSFHSSIWPIDRLHGQWCDVWRSNSNDSLQIRNSRKTSRQNHLLNIWNILYCFELRSFSGNVDQIAGVGFVVDVAFQCCYHFITWNFIVVVVELSRSIVRLHLGLQRFSLRFHAITSTCLGIRYT